MLYVVKISAFYNVTPHPHDCAMLYAKFYILPKLIKCENMCNKSAVRPLCNTNNSNSKDAPWMSWLPSSKLVRVYLAWFGYIKNTNLLF